MILSPDPYTKYANFYLNDAKFGSDTDRGFNLLVLDNNYSIID